MPRKNSLDGSLDDAPNHIRIAIAVDRGWVNDARCRNHPDVKPTAWTISPGERLWEVDATAEQLIEMALNVCWGCPVQYDCVRFALATMPDVKTRVGTWAVEIGGLNWLARSDRAQDIIDACEEMGVAVQDGVRNVMAATAA